MVRVHFTEEEGHDGQITYTVTHDPKPHVEANLGFVKAHHNYSAQLVVPVAIPHKKIVSGGEIEVGIKDSRAIGTSTHINLEFHIGNSPGLKLTKLNFVENGVNNGQVTIHMNILAEHKGTPLLKDGIHVLGTNNDGNSISGESSHNEE